MLHFTFDSICVLFDSDVLLNKGNWLGSKCFYLVSSLPSYMVGFCGDQAVTCAMFVLGHGYLYFARQI